MQFLSATIYDAHMIINVTGQPDTDEYLLVFSKLGVYVDSQGRRKRSQELMFPCKPVNGFSFIRPHLCLFADQQVDIFNVLTAQWIQTINLKKAKPLGDECIISMCHILEMPHFIMFSPLNGQEDELILPSWTNIQQKTVKRRRKFSVKTGKDDIKHGDRRSQLPISGPTNFVHIRHMGPNHVEPLQNLLDEPINKPNIPELYNLNQQNQNKFNNPVMRSTSSSSTGIHSIQRVKDDSGRPLSSHSRNSDGKKSYKTKFLYKNLKFRIILRKRYKKFIMFRSK